MTKRKLRPWVVITFMIICLTGVIYSSYKITTWKLNVDESNEIKNRIKNNITVVEPKPEPKVEPDPQIDDQTVKYDVDFEKLKEINKDTVAYVKLDNSNIDYVVVKGSNNGYYLTHNFEKKKSVTGWIFGDYHNKFDESDRNLVIYGHNTKDGSMFGTLKNILEKEWYENEENRYVVLVTENGQYEYQIFSIYSIIPEDYYINTIFKNDKEFGEFVKKIKSRSIYDFNVEVSSEDKILTLSSCLTGGKKRVALHAKLIKKIELD